MEITTLNQDIVENNNELSAIQWKITTRLLPVAIILYVFVTIGIIGNIFAIAFYVNSSKRTPPTLLITSLAITDLGTCLAAIPVISEMLINVTYSVAIMCKVTHFFGLWAGACACFVLWLISIDRYRKICNPLGKQMTISTVKYLVIGVASFSLLLAVRLLVTFDIIEVEVHAEDVNKTVTGLYCATHDDYNLISLVFYSIDFLMILMIWVTVVVTYSRIIYTVVRRRLFLTKSSTQKSLYLTQTSGNRRKDTKNNISKRDENAIGNRVKDKGNKPHDIDFDDKSSSDIRTDDTEISTIANCNEVQKERKNRCSKNKTQNKTFEYSNIRKPSEVKLTLMMFAVSMIFILCFTPYFAIRIFIRIVLDSGKEYDFSAGIQFALKFPYVNSAFNPIIYYIFSPHLRRYIHACFTKC